METYQRLLLENKAWAAEKKQLDSDYFLNLSKEQRPTYLWIGCSDSRVPANEITNTYPGEMFVHRNIANLVVHTDLNVMSVVQYAVDVLEVKHIIVCGHYGCGGVKAAMGNSHLGLINKWLRNIKDVYRLHREELDAIQNEKDRTDRLVELNIIEQSMNLAQTSFIQSAWQKRKGPMIHGWVYHMEDGILREISKISPGQDIDPIFRYDF